MTSSPVDPSASDHDAASGPEDSREAALEAAFERLDSRRPPVDVRLSVPMFGRRYYVVLLAGTELRARERRRRDRQRHPLLTLGNVLFLAATVAVIYALGLVAMVFFNGLLPVGWPG